jgi:hypothetical protein
MALPDLDETELGILRKEDGCWRRESAVQSAVLLDRRQMQFLYSDAKIVSERFLGLAKSLIAIR